MVHRDQGAIQTVDKAQLLAQRKKLTQANFNMGKSPVFYATTNKNAFVPVSSHNPSLNERKQAVDRNRRTNFISLGDGGFEAPSKKFNFASVPDKGSNDNSEVKAMIDNLRKEHFKLGD